MTADTPEPHYPGNTYVACDGQTVRDCTGCGQRWPCMTAYNAARAEVTRLAEVHNLTLQAMDDAARAALAAGPAAPAGLDVERLARALAHERAGVRTSWEGWLDAARALAAEYAALGAAQEKGEAGS